MVDPPKCTPMACGVRWAKLPAVAITAKMAKPKLPTHIGIKATGTGIERDSVILLEQIRTIDKSRLKEKVCHLDRPIMAEVDRALKISVGIEALTPVTK